MQQLLLKPNKSWMTSIFLHILCGVEDTHGIFFRNFFFDGQYWIFNF